MLFTMQAAACTMLSMHDSGHHSSAVPPLKLSTTELYHQASAPPYLCQWLCHISFAQVGIQHTGGAERPREAPLKGGEGQASVGTTLVLMAAGVSLGPCTKPQIGFNWSCFESCRAGGTGVRVRLGEFRSQGQRQASIKLSLRGPCIFAPKAA